MGNDGRRGEAIVDTPFSYETRILLFSYRISYCHNDPFRGNDSHDNHSCLASPFSHRVNVFYRISEFTIVIIIVTLIFWYSWLFVKQTHKCNEWLLSSLLGFRGSN